MAQADHARVRWRTPFGPRAHWLLLCILLCTSLLSGCSTSPSTAIGSELSVYSFAEYLPAELLQNFEKETGVKVTLATYANNEELLAELETHPTQYDVIIPSDYAVEILINNDALQPLDLTKIPNYNNIEPSFLSPYFDPGGVSTSRRPAARNQKFTLPYLWGTTGIAYDTTKVTDPITSWADLWRPELAGHLVVLDDAREMVGLTLLTLGYDKNSTNAEQIAAAGEKLKQLAPGIIAFDSAKPEQYLLSGEAWAGVVFNGNAALANQANPNIRYVFPQEGAGIWFDNLAIPTGAPHSEAAYAFINYLLAKEQGALILEEFPYSSPNQAAIETLKESKPDLYQAYIDNPINNPAQDVVSAAKLNKNLKSEASARYEQTWAAIRGQK